MGYGDEIMATGMAKGARARGKKIAFGDGRNIIFSPWSKLIFQDNPNVAHPGEEGDKNLEWIAHHKGNRAYNSLHHSHTRWVWKGGFHATPGEFFFNNDELNYSMNIAAGSVVIEPNVPRHKSVSKNKDWGASRYSEVCRNLIKKGHRVVQFDYGNGMKCDGATLLKTPTIRHASAILSRAGLYIGPEGGLHHAAAAVGVPAVVIFGGFIPPKLTGYSTHVNLTGGATTFCGSLDPCQHCRKALDAITVEQVTAEAERLLS